MKTNNETCTLSAPFLVFVAILEENEKLRPYLEAWSGPKIYRKLTEIATAFLFVTIVSEFSYCLDWMLNENNTLPWLRVSVSVLCLVFLTIGSFRIIRCFCRGVTWIEINDYHSTMVSTSNRTLDSLLSRFVPDARDILRIEKSIVDESMFPSRARKLRKTKDKHRRWLAEQISLIRPFFVELRADNVFGRLFYLAKEQN